MSRGSSASLELWEYAQRLLALILLPAALLIAGAFAALIRLGSPGPILIPQCREGRSGETFRIYKLRTMVLDAERVLDRELSRNEQARSEWERFGRLAEDPRIAGGAARLARRFSIDEMPQILNVIRGEMNLVGPRPLPPEIAARMAPADRLCRQSLRPGITGLWQVSGRSDLSITEMGRIDRIYVSRRTFAVDLIVLLRTVPAVVNGRGAY